MSCRKNKSNCLPPRCQWIKGVGCRQRTPQQRLSPPCGTRRKLSCSPPCQWINSRCRSPQYTPPAVISTACESRRKANCTSPCVWSKGRCRSPPLPNESDDDVDLLNCRGKLKRDCVTPCQWVVGTGCISPPSPRSGLSLPRSYSSIPPTLEHRSFTDSERSLLEPSRQGNFELVLRDVQQRAVEHMRHHDSLLIVFGTGMGKTITAVTIALEYLQEKPRSRVVVISPKSLLNNFSKELARHYAITNESRITCLSYGQFHNKMKKNHRFCNNKLFIIDEVHNFRNPKGLQLLSALKCASKSSKQVLLTATPFVNSTKDIGPIISLLYGEAAPTNTKKIDMNRLLNKVIYAPKIIDARYFPTYTEHKQFITMTPAYQAKLDKQLCNKDIYTKPEIFFNGYRRVVNGVRAGDSYLSFKMPFVVQTILADPTKKNLIYSNWLEHGVRIVEDELSKNRITYEIIVGDTSVSGRNDIVAAFNDREFNTLIISNAGAEGLDLKEVENVFVIDPPWNPAGIDQVIGRSIRYNSHENLPPNRRHVNIYYLILQQREVKEGERPISGDVLLYDIIDRKRQDQEEFLSLLARISI